MTTNPPLLALVEILQDCQMFDHEIERNVLWVSGTYQGRAFTVQLNYDGVGTIVRDKLSEIQKQ